MAHSLILSLLSVLLVATLSVALCQRFGVSPVLGYLATGVLTGPAWFGWLPDDANLHRLAELGVVLLMFTIGLEFSLPRLLAAKRLVVGLGGAQLLLTSLLFFAIGRWSGLSAAPAFVVAAALAMSSTAIVLKHLGEHLELAAPHGRIASGVLLFQDVASVPLLVMVTILAADPARLGAELGWALAKTGLVFAGLVVVGRWLLPPLLNWVAASRSLELFMLSALLLALSAAGVSSLAGLAPTLGAFMAGMLLGETPFRHQVEADIRPFRDLMLGLFFVTIGTRLDVTVFLHAPGAVLLVLFAVVVLKALVVMPLIRAFGHSGGDAWRAAIALAQGGEFGLLLISAASSLGLLGAEVAQPVLGGLILSMAVAPLLLRFDERIAAGLSRGDSPASSRAAEAHIAAHGGDFDRHVIICGLGRVGQNLLGILQAEGIPALALDLDPERVRQAVAAGQPVFLGNAAQPGILRAAGVERARALAISMDDTAVATRIVAHVRALGAELPILARSTRGRDDAALIAAGAEVFPEGLESSLAFAGQLLIMLGLPPSRVETRLNRIRAMSYAPLRAFFHDSGEPEDGGEALDYPEQMLSVVLEEGHFAIGRTPGELDLGEQGVELTDIRRGAMRVPGDRLDGRLRAGDVLVLKGGKPALEHVMARLLEGF